MSILVFSPYNLSSFSDSWSLRLLTTVDISMKPQEHLWDLLCLFKDQWVAALLCRGWHHQWSYLSSSWHSLSWMAGCDPETHWRSAETWNRSNPRGPRCSLCSFSPWWSSLRKIALQSLTFAIGLNHKCTLGYSHSGADLVWIDRWHIIPWRAARFFAVGVLRVAKILGTDLSVAKSFGESLLPRTWLEFVQLIYRTFGKSTQRGLHSTFCSLKLEV